MPDTYLDSIVKACSAFPSWSDLVYAIVNHGYTPTVRGRTRRERVLRAALAHQGYPVFPAAI